MAGSEPSALKTLAERLIDRVLEFGINGGGPLKCAVPVADEHLLAAGGDREEVVRRLVATHVRLAAVSGFATGIGGLVTLPVSVPAATAGLYIIAPGRARGSPGRAATTSAPRRCAARSWSRCWAAPGPRR